MNTEMGKEVKDETNRNANHAKAPEMAKFVSAMREVFGEVKVLYIKENEVLYGNPSELGASCRLAGSGISWREWKVLNG